MTKVKSKKECYQLYEAGLFGNKALTWNSYQDILDSSWRGLICMRSKRGIARKKVQYDLTLEQTRDKIQEWEKLGIREQDISFNQSMPNQDLLIQGEIMNNPFSQPFGLYVLYTTVKKPMNLGLREQSLHTSGLEALMLLKRNLWPSDYEDIRTLLELYPEAAIEFSTYNTVVGDIQNRNTVIWEVRNF